MATAPSIKLQMTILKVARYMSIEWDMSLHETVGAIEQAKLTLWNEWDSMNPPDLDDLLEADDDDDD